MSAAAAAAAVTGTTAWTLSFVVYNVQSDKLPASVFSQEADYDATVAKTAIFPVIVRRSSQDSAHGLRNLPPGSSMNCSLFEATAAAEMRFM